MRPWVELWHSLILTTQEAEGQHVSLAAWVGHDPGTNCGLVVGLVFGAGRPYLGLNLKPRAPLWTILGQVVLKALSGALWLQRIGHSWASWP
jgi:hypothetical protein